MKLNGHNIEGATGMVDMDHPVTARADDGADDGTPLPTGGMVIAALSFMFLGFCAGVATTTIVAEWMGLWR